MNDILGLILYGSRGSYLHRLRACIESRCRQKGFEISRSKVPLEEIAELVLVGGVVGSITSLQPQPHGLKAERPRQYVGIPAHGTTQPSQLKQGHVTTSNLEPAGGFVNMATFKARDFRGVRRAHSTPQRLREEAQRENRPTLQTPCSARERISC